jgi:hypothetical protein
MTPEHVAERSRTDEFTTGFVEGSGVSENVCELIDHSDDAQLVTDIAVDAPAGFDTTQSRDYRSYVSVPVRAADVAFGMLTINSIEAAGFTEEDAAAMRVLARLLNPLSDELHDEDMRRALHDTRVRPPCGRPAAAPRGNRPEESPPLASQASGARCEDLTCAPARSTLRFCCRPGALPLLNGAFHVVRDAGKAIFGAFSGAGCQRKRFGLRKTAQRTLGGAASAAYGCVGRLHEEGRTGMSSGALVAVFVTLFVVLLVAFVLARRKR